MRKPRNDDRALLEMLGSDQEFAVEYLHMVYDGLDEEEEEEQFLAALYDLQDRAADAGPTAKNH